MKPKLHLFLLAVVAVPSISFEGGAREIQVSHESSAQMLQIEHAQENIFGRHFIQIVKALIAAISEKYAFCLLCDWSTPSI